jgi:hypothetical protein
VTCAPCDDLRVTLVDRNLDLARIAPQFMLRCLTTSLHCLTALASIHRLLKVHLIFVH